MAAILQDMCKLSIQFTICTNNASRRLPVRCFSPRNLPPSVSGNVETLARVPHIVTQSAGWFRALGRGQGTGTKLYSLSGDVLYPGVFEWARRCAS
jgi:hypothetical protein